MDYILSLSLKFPFPSDKLLSNFSSNDISHWYDLTILHIYTVTYSLKITFIYTYIYIHIYVLFIGRPLESVEYDGKASNSGFHRWKDPGSKGERYCLSKWYSWDSLSALCFPRIACFFQQTLDWLLLRCSLHTSPSYSWQFPNCWMWINFSRGSWDVEVLADSTLSTPWYAKWHFGLRHLVSYTVLAP